MCYKKSTQIHLNFAQILYQLTYLLSKKCLNFAHSQKLIHNHKEFECSPKKKKKKKKKGLH